MNVKTVTMERGKRRRMGSVREKAERIIMKEKEKKGNDKKINIIYT